RKIKNTSLKRKKDVILPLQSELASPKIKGYLNDDEDIGVDEVVGGGEAFGVSKDDDSGNRPRTGVMMRSKAGTYQS
ncbi:hypothetical protein Tco_0498088, partial [Tanacetum coccineum]